LDTDKFYAYEKTLSAKKKKQLGIIYTPINIVSYINESVLSLWKGSGPPKVCDFSCGTGIFLADMANKIAKRWDMKMEDVMDNCIFGNDVDLDAVKVCKDLLGCENITNINGLDFDLSNYDIIVANPPYVRLQNCDAETKARLADYEWVWGDSDLYVAFLQKIMESGKLYGLISPNSWIKNVSGKFVRNCFMDKQNVVRFIDFRDKPVFKGVQTYTSILVGNAASNKQYQFGVDVDKFESKNYCDKSSFFLTNEEINSIKHIEQCEESFLDCFNFSVGLATQRDPIYFLPDCSPSNRPGCVYVKDKDIHIEKSITRLCYKNGKLSRYDKPIDDRIIFPYDKDNKLLDEAVFKSKYPLAYRYLEEEKTKESLLKRDGGKFKKRCEAGQSKWYEYGRTQGLKINDEKILIATIGKTIPHKKVNDGLFISGYAITEKENSMYTLDDAIEIISSKEANLILSLKGKPLQSGYYQINKEFFKNIRFERRKDES